MTSILCRRLTRPETSGRCSWISTACMVVLTISSAGAFSSTFHESIRPSQLYAVKDPDTLLRKPGEKEKLERDVSVIESMYSRSAINELDEINDLKTVPMPRRSSVTLPRTTNIVTEEQLRQSKSNKPEFRRVAISMNRPTMTEEDKTRVKKSRSNTMTRIVYSSRERDFEESIHMAEARSGSDLSVQLTASARAKRSQMNGEAMYRMSAAVPDSLVQFANQIHKEGRITPTEECELGQLTQEAIRLQNLYEKLEDKLGREPKDEEWCAAAGKINLEAIQQAMDEGLEAKNKLVTSNLRMVQSVVNTYIRNGLGGEYNAGDMMQEGIMALIRAAEKYEPQRGFRFSTYAMYWIRAAVKRSQTVQSRVIPLPQRLHANYKRVVKMDVTLRHSLGRTPTKKELSAAVGMSVEQVERCSRAMDQRIYSLDETLNNPLNPNGDSNGDTMYDIIASRTGDGEHTKIQRDFFREDLIETLHRHLTQTEVQLLMLRFGMIDQAQLPPGYEGSLTIAEVSKLVGIKPDKVRRMILNSLQQMKFVIGEEWNDFEQQIRLL